MDLAVGPKLQLLFQGKTLFRSEASGKTWRNITLQSVKN
jgi:hypothetical protein